MHTKSQIPFSGVSWTSDSDEVGRELSRVQNIVRQLLDGRWESYLNYTLVTADIVYGL